MCGSAGSPVCCLVDASAHTTHQACCAQPQQRECQRGSRRDNSICDPWRTRSYSLMARLMSNGCCTGRKLAGKDLLDGASSEGSSSAFQAAAPDLLAHFMRPASAPGLRHLQLASVWEEAQVSKLLWQTLVEVNIE